MSRYAPAWLALVAVSAWACRPQAVSSDQEAFSSLPPTTIQASPSRQPAAGATSEPGRQDAQTTAPLDVSEPGCPSPRPAGQPTGPSAGAQLLSAGTGGVPRVEAVVYPRPNYEGNPWSQWGQGLALEDGRFFSAIGDHLGADGNSYLYEYDPGSSTLYRIGDILSTVEHQPGDWGYGKIHAQLVGGPCGEIFLSTYWGTTRNLSYGSTYQGDYLMRLDSGTRELQALDVPVEQHGIPSLAGWREGGLLYGESADPDSKNTGAFFVYDVNSQDVTFVANDVSHVGFRNVMVDAEGAAYFSADEGRLHVYDPATGQLGLHPGRMPGRWLRASTRPGPDGTVYAVTRDPDVLFAREPTGEIRDLGPARGYVASLALHPSGERFFYVPEAHGRSWEQRTPVVSVDTKSGSEEVLVELNPLAEEQLGLRLGGSYNLAVDPSGRLLYVGLNAGPQGDEETFGEVVLMVVHLP
jgi:hypothetical protein